MSKLLTGDKLVKAIADLEVSANKIAERIHLIACSVAIDVARTGNVTNLNAFMKATEKIGKRSVMRWLAKHAPVKLNDAKDAFLINDKKVEQVKAAGLDATETKLVEGPTYASEAPKSDTNPFHFDLDDVLRMTLARANKAKDQIGKPGVGEINLDRIEALAAIVASMPAKVTKSRKLTAASATANAVAA